MYMYLCKYIYIYICQPLVGHQAAKEVACLTRPSESESDSVLFVILYATWLLLNSMQYSSVV